MAKNDTLTIAQAIEIAGCSRATLSRAARLGELKAKKIGTQWTIRRADLDAWIAAGGYEPQYKRQIAPDRAKL